jgi:hypothetical protein
MCFSREGIAKIAHVIVSPEHSRALQGETDEQRDVRADSRTDIPQQQHLRVPTPQLSVVLPSTKAGLKGVSNGVVLG